MRRALIGVVVLAAALSVGCTRGMVTVFALFAPFGEPMVEAKCPLKGKRVTLLVTPTTEIQWSHADHMQRLAAELWREMRAKVDGVDLVPLPDIQDLRDSQPDFDRLSREQIGERLKSDVVVEIDVNEYTLSKSGVDLVLRGNAVMTVRVADVKQRGKVLWTGLVDYTYPQGRPQILGDTDRATFARRFLRKLAQHTTRNFYTYPEADKDKDKEF